MVDPRLRTFTQVSRNDVIHVANDNKSVRRRRNFIKTLQLKIGCYACTLDGI